MTGWFLPAAPWPVTGPGNRQRRDEGLPGAWGRGWHRYSVPGGPGLHGDHQPHNCDSGQHQCSQTSTVCVSLFALSHYLLRHYFKQAFKHKKVLQTDKHPKYLNIDVHNCKCQNWRTLYITEPRPWSPSHSILISANT